MLVPLALLSILAACGASGKHAGPAQVVAGPGFTYTAPAGWKVRRTRFSTTAASGVHAVFVTVFTLRRHYVQAQFHRAVGELDGTAKRLAADSQGKLTESVTTTIAGRKARAYRYTTTTHDSRVAFVLAGRHEYELFCRDAKDPACPLLFSSFSLR